MNINYTSDKLIFVPLLTNTLASSPILSSPPLPLLPLFMYPSIHPRHPLPALHYVHFSTLPVPSYFLCCSPFTQLSINTLHLPNLSPSSSSFVSHFHPLPFIRCQTMQVKILREKFISVAWNSSTSLASFTFTLHHLIGEEIDSQGR